MKYVYIFILTFFPLWYAESKTSDYFLTKASECKLVDEGHGVTCIVFYFALRYLCTQKGIEIVYDKADTLHFVYTTHHSKVTFQRRLAYIEVSSDVVEAMCSHIYVENKPGGLSFPIGFPDEPAEINPEPISLKSLKNGE